jgi:hypothetical protein
MKLFSFFVLLLTPLVAFSADIDLPKEVKGKVGDFIQINSKAITDVEWYIVDAGIQFLPFDLLKDKKTAILFTLNPGKYRVLAWTAKDSKPSPAYLCLVTIEPNDFIPTPTPVPVEPTVLEKRLKPFYIKDTSPDKKIQLNQLKTLFGELQKLSLDANITTIGELFKAGAEISTTLLADKILSELRAELNAYMDETLPRVSSQALDQKTKELCFSVFGEIKKTLDKLGE